MESSSWAQSIIIAAVPQPYSYVVFEWNHKPHQLLIPPSYVRYWEVTERAESELNALIGARGALVGFARLPQKLLAARSGLARYGKNNIAYVPEFGSHHMLVSFYSSLPCVEETWAEPLMLESCRRCTACLRACPSQAIGKDSFVIRQDRCITFYSGYSGQQDFPGWLKPEWIECLIGCRKCQVVCPANGKFRSRPPAVEESFSEEETGILRDGPGSGKLPAALRRKLDRLGLIRFFGLSECLEMLKKKLSLLLVD